MENKWISVEDALPKKREGFSHSKDVNVCYSDMVISTGSYSYQNTRWDDYLYKIRGLAITFWQPLPEPPNELKD